MATIASPMASQLKSSFTSSVTRGLVVPRGISGAPFRVSPGKIRTSSFTVKAVQADKPTYQVIQPINGDPFIGSLETPITSSPLIAWYLSNLPAYRTAVNPLLRGIEVGLAHGSLLVGPFVKTGPLRNTDVAGQAGSLCHNPPTDSPPACVCKTGISGKRDRVAYSDVRDRETGYGPDRRIGKCSGRFQKCPHQVRVRNTLENPGHPPAAEESGSCWRQCTVARGYCSCTGTVAAGRL